MLDYVALAILISVALILFYGIIVVHDIPYDIAKEREHPHQDAIHVAGWISLLTLHVIWPFLWIWATLYRPDRGWGIKHSPSHTADDTEQQNHIDQLKQQVAHLTERLEMLEQQQRPPTPAAEEAN